MKKPKVITVAAYKGGVGKSTTAAALISYIPRCRAMGYTLGMSTDTQDSVSTILNLDAPRGFPSLAEQIMSDSLGIHGFPVSLSQHSYYLPAGLDLFEMVDDFKGQGRNLAEVFSEKIAKTNVEHSYDYIIIDCAPALSELTNAAIAVADYVIIPMLPVPMDIPGLRSIIDYTNAISEVQGLKSKVAGILFCLDDHYKINEEVKSIIEAQYPGLPFRQTIRRTVKMEEAILSHTLLDPVSQNFAAKDYLEFTEEFLSRIRK